MDLAPPKMGEVLVKMKATGVCHSDLSVINGTIPSPFPVVLGHEGAGMPPRAGGDQRGLFAGERTSAYNHVDEVRFRILDPHRPS